MPHTGNALLPSTHFGVSASEHQPAETFQASSLLTTLRLT